MSPPDPPPRPQPVRPSDLVPPQPSEPTPWATGLTATVMVAALVTSTDLLLTRSLHTAFGWVWIPGNLLVGVGLAPSLWLLRRVPFWRWIAYGVAAGIGLAWAGLILGLLLRAPA